MGLACLLANKSSRFWFLVSNGEILGEVSSRDVGARVATCILIGLSLELCYWPYRRPVFGDPRFCCALITPRKPSRPRDSGLKNCRQSLFQLESYIFVYSSHPEEIHKPKIGKSANSETIPSKVSLLVTGRAIHVSCCS